MRIVQYVTLDVESEIKGLYGEAGWNFLELRCNMDYTRIYYEWTRSGPPVFPDLSDYHMPAPMILR